jgi:uncharacterized protein YdaU (DUF1376 family)
MTHPFIPLYVDDYEAATVHLSPEEDGIYNRLLRLCWRTPGCSLPSDAGWIARKIRVSAEYYERVVHSLLTEFFVLQKGRWTQLRLKREYDDITRRKNGRKLAGKQGGLSKARKTKEKTSSNASFLLGDTRATPYPYPYPESETHKESLPATRARAKSATGNVVKIKARRCPADWAPSLQIMEVGLTEGLGEGQIERQLAMMRDHEFRDAHSDWDAVARNWLRRAAADERKRHDRQPTFRELDFEARQANLERAFRASAAGAGSR